MDADVSTMQTVDLFTTEDIVDRLVDSVIDNDVYLTIVFMRDLKKRAARDMINTGHSESGMAPLVVAGAKDYSRTASLLVRLLLAGGARLLSPTDVSEWTGPIQPWALDIINGERPDDSREEKDVQLLLEQDDQAVDRWCQENLPAPSAGLDYSELFGGYATDEESVREASLPVETIRARLSLLRLETPTEDGAGPSIFGGMRHREASEPIKPSVSATVDVLDLTDDCSPSPVPKEEEVEHSLGSALLSSLTQRVRGRKRAASRSRSPERREAQRVPRAHLRVDNLPTGFTSEQLQECFSSEPGVLDAEVHLSQSGVLWGFVSMASLATAQHAFASKDGTHLNATARDVGAPPLALKIYSGDGTPIEPQMEVEPVVHNVSGRMPLSVAGRDVEAASASGNFRPGVRNAYPRDRLLALGERPRVPYMFTAAELKRRVYCGSLRFDISYAEVASLFSEIAGVVARVLKVLNAHDNSHSFAFVQLADDVTANYAIQKLHGLRWHDGHLLQVEHVNELNHRSLFSLTLYGLPRNWEYRDVSDFLIRAIGSFAGMIVNPPRVGDLDPSVFVRVELRYETWVRWAFTELNDLPVQGTKIRAHIDQPRIREKVNREMAHLRISDMCVAQGVSNAARRGHNTPYSVARASMSTSPAYYPVNPSSARDGGSVTPGGRRKCTPPPPPPLAPQPLGEDACSTGQGEAYNPFALSCPNNSG